MLHYATTWIATAIVLLAAGVHARTGADAVFIFLDSLNDGYTATVFVTNPLGTQWDFRITDNGRTTDSEWDVTWEVAAARTAEG